MSAKTRGRHNHTGWVSVNQHDHEQEISSPIKEREWLSFGKHQREQLELTFTMSMNAPINNSWSSTERYVQSRDAEMLEYLQDFPINTWLIGGDAARAAYKAFLERDRLRNAGHSIFSENKPKWWSAEANPVSQHSRHTSSEHTSGLTDEMTAGLITASEALPHKQARLAEPQPRKKRKITEPTKQDCASASLFASVDWSRPISPHLTSGRTFGSFRPLTYEHAEQALTPDKDDLGKDAQGKLTSSTEHVTDSELPTPADHDSIQRPNKTRPKVSKTPKSVHCGLHFMSKLTSSRVEVITPPPYLSTTGGPTVDDSAVEFPWEASFCAERPVEWLDDMYDDSLHSAIEEAHKANSLALELHTQSRDHDPNTGEAGKPSNALRGTSPRDLQKTIANKSQENGKSVRSRTKRKSDEQSLDVDGATGVKTRKTQAVHVSSSDLGAGLKFADAEAERVCKQAGLSNIACAVDAAMRDPFSEVAKSILVVNDAGESSIPGVRNPQISIRDVARTRLQLNSLRVLSDKAAMRMVDYCPSMLTDYKLLQVIGETSHTNTGIQRRLALNGVMISDSTITKRVTAALSKSQVDDSAGQDGKLSNAPKATNRQNYNKYKLFHNKQRELGEPLTSQFSLAEAAKQYIASTPQELVAPKKSVRRSIASQSSTIEPVVKADSTVATSEGPDAKVEET